MAVSISNITDLISSEKAQNPYGWVNQGSETQNDCHNYKLAGTSQCGDLVDIELYLDIPAFDPIQYKKTEKTLELTPGKELSTYKMVDPQVIFSVIGDETLHNQLQQLALHQTIAFTNIDEAMEESVYSMEVSATPADVLLEIKVTLSFTDAEQITRLCCGSYYENAPFNECDGEGETGEPNNDPACSEYAVSIALTTGPDTLTASSVGGDGIETFTWYKDGVYFAIGSAINPVLSGVYRVDAVKGNCTDQATYGYSAGCEGFEVTILELAQPDGTVIYVAQANIVSTYQWQEEIAAVWTDLGSETSVAFEPDHSGTFRVIATAGDCEATSASVEYEAPESCTGVFTLTIENNEGTLEVTVVDYAGEGTPTYEWYLDTGAGLVLLPSETAATLADATPGYYVCIVTIDGCTQTIGLLIQCVFADISNSDCVDDSNWSQTFNGDDTSVDFEVTNFYLVDPVYVTAVEITATYLVTRNGVALTYSATPATVGEYGIDYATQKITLAAGFPLLTGDILIIRKLKTVKL
jgi:hypothetical protein